MRMFANTSTAAPPPATRPGAGALPDLIRSLRERGLGTIIVREAEQKVALDRGTLFRRLQDLRMRELRELPPLRERACATRAAADKARAEAEAAAGEALLAESEADRTVHALNSQIGRLLRELRDLAPPEIDEFIAECRSLEVEVRNQAQGQVTSAVRTVATSYYLAAQVATNAKAITEACTAIHAAIAAAEDLAVADLTREDVLQRLDALRGALPNPRDLAVELLPSAINDIARLSEMMAAGSAQGVSPRAPRRRGAAFFR